MTRSSQIIMPEVATNSPTPETKVSELFIQVYVFTRL